MKRSALQCAVGFIGATLIVVGVVWTCRQLSSPTQLNAAQDNQADLSFNSRVRPSGSLSLSVTPETNNSSSTKREANQSVRKTRIRPTSGNELNLTVVNTPPASIDPMESSATTEDSFPSSLDIFDELDAIETQENFESSFQTNNQSLDETSVLVEEATKKETINSNQDYLSIANNVDEKSFPSTLSLSIANDAQTDLSSQTTNESQPLEQEDFIPSSDAIARLDSLADYEQTPQAPAYDSTNVEIDPLDSNSSIESTVQQDASLQSLNEIHDNYAPQSMKEIQSLEEIPNPSSIPSFNANLPNKTNAGSSGLIASLLQFVENDSVSIPTPNEKYDGVQSSQVTIEKITPNEVQMNKPVTIVVSVKNLGNKEIKNAVLRDSVPEGAQFSSCPAGIVPDINGELVWPKFDLQPQSEKKFEYTIVPVQEGILGSVANLLIIASASGQIMSARPELKVEVTAPEQVELGESVNFNITVANIGSGVANNIVLQEIIPEGLFHPSGSVLNNGLGTLKAGEIKRLPLSLKTSAAGLIINQLKVSADDCETQNVETPIKVIAPAIELAISGPQEIYLERDANYKLSIKNTGDASAYNVKLTAKLPEGSTFVSANNLGVYRASDRSVYWDLAELPAQMDADIELAIKTIKAAQTELVFSASGPNNLTAQTSQVVSIDGLAALSFNVSSSTDLVEVGKEFEYAVQIENRGTKSSNNVILQILPPEAVTILATDGPTKARDQRGVIVFEKIDSIPPKSNVVYKIKATPSVAGDCRVEFQLSSDDLEPLTKEENTRVYK